MANRKSIVVIGLDGGTFKVFRPWIDQGKLPTLKHLMENGAWGELESCLPPVTSPAWKCYSTGKNPGKLGIFWWRQVDRVRKKIVESGSSTLFRSLDLWDYLGQAGYRVASVGMPLTYPPRPLNGYMVSGHPYAESSGYTYPPELECELEQHLAYRIHPKLAPQADNRLTPEVLEAIKEVVGIRFDAALYLLSREKLDFLSVVTFDLNMLQHLCWREPPVEELWNLVDAKVAEVIEHFDYVFVISDHGLSRLEREFYLNVWLLERGYLVLNDSFEQHPGFKLTRLMRRLLTKGSEFLRIKETLKSALPAAVRHWGIAQPGGREIRHASRFEESIDWDKSRVVATPQGPVYLINYSSEEERIKLRDQIAEQLGPIRDPVTGKRVVENIHKREDIYCGHYLEETPDLVVESVPEVYIREGKPGCGLFGDSNDWQAGNYRYGIFIAYGPDIRCISDLSNIQIVDVAPTILKLMGVEPPEDMDGRVLHEVFEKPLEPGRVIEIANNNRETAYSVEEEIQIGDHLRQLGYLD